MAGYHNVVQGEHVPGLAAKYGFSDYLVIWNHPNNADLKTTRLNPNVLFPGDSLFIPDRTPTEYPRPTEKKHQFVLNRPPLKLCLTLEDQFEKPIANTPCILTVDSASHTVTTDADGKIELVIPPTATTSSLIIQDNTETPHGNITIPLKLGNLDPVEEVSGQKGRLNGLGYFWGKIDGNKGPDFESAVEEFQCDNSLTVDGICGPNTQAKLKLVYGC